MSKLILQVCTAARALIPIVTGIISLLGVLFRVHGVTRLELLGAPAFICWQTRVAEAFRP
jgi:hypothetical protein